MITQNLSRLLVSLLAVGLMAPVHAKPADAESEVRAEFARWMAAYKDHDLAGTMAIFAADVRFAFQGGPDVGYAELKRSYEQDFKVKSAAEWVGTIDEVQASGDLAAEFSTWKFIDPAGNMLAHNRGMDLLRRDAQGRWRIVRSLNYPVKPPTPPPAAAK